MLDVPDPPDPDLTVAAVLTRPALEPSCGGQTIFYVKFDHAHRPHQVWRHTLGSADDALVYEDNDELFDVGCWATNDGSLIVIESESKETTELHYIQCDAPASTPTMIRARKYGVRCDNASKVSSPPSGIP